MLKDFVLYSDPDEWNIFIDSLDKANLKPNFDYKVVETPQFIKITYKNMDYQFNKLLTDRRKINSGNIWNSFKTITKFENKINKDKFGYKEIFITPFKKKVKWDFATDFGFAYYDENFNNQWLKCWSYDINSAFAFAMLKPMPDTSKEPRYNDYVKRGEMGFYKMGGATTKVGEYAEVIFSLQDSPFKEYIIKYYNLKKNATEKEFRTKYKDFLNIPTGMMQRYDIFIRNAIIYWSNKYIKSFIDENTVYCNVDCIISLVPRYDIPVGEEIGQFKCEHICDNFKYKQSGIYQWNDECHYQGIPARTIKDINDIEGWQENIDYIIKDRKAYRNEKKEN